jgi:hypothetical protein
VRARINAVIKRCFREGQSDPQISASVARELTIVLSERGVAERRTAMGLKRPRNRPPSLTVVHQVAPPRPKGLTDQELIEQALARGLKITSCPPAFAVASSAHDRLTPEQRAQHEDHRKKMAEAAWPGAAKQEKQNA